MFLKYAIAAAALTLVGGAPAFAATLKSTASLSVTLTPDNPSTVNQSGIAYDPTLGLYYGGNAGSTSYNGFTWNSAGVLQSTDTQGIDVRGMWYNPNTGTVETNTFNSASGASNLGLVTVDRGLSGEWGGSGTKIRTLSGTPSSQSTMEYDADRNVLYARNGSNLLTVIDYDTGAALSTILLTGLNAGTQLYTVGYISSLDALVTYSQSAGEAQVFDMTGALLGAVSVGGVGSSGNFGMAYENGLLFVYDQSATSWKGYDITNGDDDVIVNQVPLPAGLPLLLAGLGAFGYVRRKRTA